MLAYITSTDDPYTTLPDVVKDNNIARRNMQVEGSSPFSIINPEEKHAMIEVSIDCGGIPVNEARTIVRLSMEYNPILADAWAKVPGTRLTHSVKEKLVHLHIYTCHLNLPHVKLPGKTYIPASVTLKLPPETKGTFVVHCSEGVNGKLKGGMSFEVKN